MFKIGEMVFEGCPGPHITDEQRRLYHVFQAAYCRVEGLRGRRFERRLSFQEVLRMPARVLEALDTIEDELHKIQTEQDSEAGG